MSAVETFLGRPEVERLGWALLHFIWQGAIGAALLGAALFVLRRASANARYLASCAVLLVMAACLPITWLVVGQRTLADGTAAAVRSFENERRQPAFSDPTHGQSDAVELSLPLPPSDEATRKVAPMRAIEAVPLAAGPVATWKQRLDALLPWIAAAWLAGVTILSIRLAIGWLDVRRLRQTASTVADDGWKSALERLAVRLGIRRPVALLESALVEVPTMIGWLRPAILWPPSLLAGLSIEQFESLLAHELAHIRRHDYLVNLIQTAIETLLFYHPAVWWVSNRIRQERECCCDDLAVAVCGNRIVYARALAAVEELRPRPRQFALAADGGRLLTRIRRILGQPAPRRGTRQHWLLGTTLSAALVLSVVVFAAKLATGDQAPPGADQHIVTDGSGKPKKANAPVSKEQPRVRGANDNFRIDLIVQTVGTNEEIIKGPANDIGDRIRPLPHVTAVARATMDVRSPKDEVQMLVFNRWPPKSPNKHDRENARRLGRTLVPGDQRQRYLGAVVALKLRAVIGDSIVDCNSDSAILGVFEENDFDLFNKEIKALMRSPATIAGFAVSTDIPRDNWPERQGSLNELCQRIEGLGDEIIAVRAKPSEEITWPSSVPVAISGNVVDDQTGKPIAFYEKEGGRVDPKDPKNVIWGAYRIRDAGDSDGSLSGSIDWYGGWRERILAPGYVPQVIVIEPLGPANTCINGVIVRLKRTSESSEKSRADKVDGSKAPVAAAPDPVPLIRILSGHAIDAETGQPVQGFIYEEATFDEQNPAQFHWNGEAIAPGSQRDGAFGIIVKNRPGKPVWARIVAPGYVPQPTTEKPIVLADDSVLDKFEVRMHRGKTLAGRVVDAAGKPVAAAGVYLLRNQGRRQVVRDPAVKAPNQQFEMLAITHSITDADGRFKMTGWDGESGRVAVLSSEMNLWVTPIPTDAADWTIRLPRPATIDCEVEDNSGERHTFYDLDLVTSGRKGWKMLRAYQFNLQSKNGQLELPNHTPGEYELTRRRKVSVGDYEGEFQLADIKLRIPEEEVFKVVLKRSDGWPIAGQVVGLKALGLSGAVISIEPPGEVKRGAMTFDAVTCGEDGRFETSRIPPGKYRVHVDAYLTKKPADPRVFRGGLDLPENARCPDFTADAEIVVGDVQPAPLKLELKKGGESRAFRELMQYHEQPHPAVIDQFTAPPWAIDAGDQRSPSVQKSDERPNAKPHEASGEGKYELIVQKRAGASAVDQHIPMEFGDHIKQLPHVKEVTGGLMDVLSFPEHDLASVFIFGLSVDSPFFKEWKLLAGRMPREGDRRALVLGKTLADDLTKRSGDKLTIYGADFEIVGIYESKNKFENGSVAMLLPELQDSMNAPNKVTGLRIKTDIPRDESIDHQAQFDDLRKQIEKLDIGLAVMAAPVDKEAATKPQSDHGESGHPAPSPAKATQENKPIEAHGQVIDDETGKPITLFDEQGGHVDPNDPNKITWGYYLKPNSGGQEGRFDANIDWGGGWRARIIAGGYLPQPILADPPKPGQTKIEGLVLRMKRGRSISGRVLDHAGKPVKNASLFVVGSRPMEITGEQALMNSSRGLVEDQSARRDSTDAEGRFTLTGIGEDAKNIAVSCQTVDLWILPAPATDEAAKDFEIRLPEPGKLIVHYDIPGGPEEATIFLQLHTWDREGWKGVDNRRRPTVKQHGELVLDNMTPGLYEVVRDSGGFLDRRQVTIEPGKTVTSDFIRKAGAPITGRIVGLDREDVQKAKPKRINISVHKPGDERNPLAPKFASVAIDPFDKNGKPSDGSFKTEIIPPGEYLVRAGVFIEEPPERGYRTGLIPPAFEGEAKVTVPEQGAPPPVEIQLKKWQYKPLEIKKTDEAAKQTTPKEAPKKESANSAVNRGQSRLAETPAEKESDDAAKGGPQSIGHKPGAEEATDAAIKKGIQYLAHEGADEATAAQRVPDEVTISVDPALAAELRALDAMRAGTSTNFEKVDEIGRKLLERYQKPEERGQIHFALLQVHGQSGLVTPEHIIEYAKQALKFPLGSRQELMVYIYWGDTLNVRKTEKRWPEHRAEAAEVYLKGLKRVWQYNAPEAPPELPTPPPVYDGPEVAEREAAVAAMKHYMELKSKADFISELNYQRKIFIRQIADMYHRRPATATEIEALKKQAGEILQNESAVAWLMAAVEGGEKKAGDQTEKSMMKIAIDAIGDARGDQPRVLISPADGAVTVIGPGTLETKHLEIHLVKPIGKWSKAEDGLEARLAIERVGSNNGTPILATYLELRNVSDSATPIEIALDPAKIEFKVTDAKGKDVQQAGLPYDGIVAHPGPLRLPHDSQLRLGVSGHGAGIPKDEGALLDLASSAVWLFKRGDTAEYHLNATVRISTSGNNSWHGTIDVPPVRIPLVK